MLRGSQRLILSSAANTRRSPMDNSIAEKQIHILRHSLGVPVGGGTEMYRNHFCTDEGATDYPDCMALVESGHMTRRNGSQLSGGYYVFYVTEIGKDAVRKHLESKNG
jgi:hypothetical protein